MICESQI